GPVRQMMSLLTMQQRARAGIERVFEIIDTAPVVRDPIGPVPLGADPPDIEFDQVHFGYGDSREVLSGLSMTIPAGQTTALIGRAGAGKSTVIALLARYYDPDAGSIRINGVDLRRARAGSGGPSPVARPAAHSDQHSGHHPSQRTDRTGHRGGLL